MSQQHPVPLGNWHKNLPPSTEPVYFWQNLETWAPRYQMQFSDENNIVNQFCCDRNPFHLTAWHFSTNFLGKIKKKIPSVSSCKLCQNLLHNGNDCMQLLGYSGQHKWSFRILPRACPQGQCSWFQPLFSPFWDTVRSLRVFVRASG